MTPCVLSRLPAQQAAQQCSAGCQLGHSKLPPASAKHCAYLLLSAPAAISGRSCKWVIMNEFERARAERIAANNAKMLVRRLVLGA